MREREKVNRFELGSKETKNKSLLDIDDIKPWEFLGFATFKEIYPDQDPRNVLEN